jgi:hypothetical protein
MKRTSYISSILAGGVMILTFASCRDELQGPEMPETPLSDRQAITIRATIGGEGEAVITRAGVVEGEPDYSKGESFRWTLNDTIHVEFTPTGGDLPTEVKFYASAVNGGTATFTVADNQPALADGSYTVLATHGFTFGAPSADPPVVIGNSYAALSTRGFTPGSTAAMPQQYDYIAPGSANSSDQMGKYFYMDAAASGVTVSGGEASLDLSFRHLTSLLRFTLVNPLAQNITVKMIDLYTIGSDGVVDDIAYAGEYTITGEDPAFTATSSTRSAVTGAGAGDGITLAAKSGDVVSSCDIYLPIFPTGLTSTASVRLELTYAIGGGSDIVTEEQFAKTATGTGAFLQEGFGTGKRYYFRLSFPYRFAELDVYPVDRPVSELAALSSNPDKAWRLPTGAELTAVFDAIAAAGGNASDYGLGSKDGYATVETPGGSATRCVRDK